MQPMYQSRNQEFDPFNLYDGVTLDGCPRPACETPACQLLTSCTRSTPRSVLRHEVYEDVSAQTSREDMKRCPECQHTYQDPNYGYAPAPQHSAPQESRSSSYAAASKPSVCASMLSSTVTWVVLGTVLGCIAFMVVLVRSDGGPLEARGGGASPSPAVSNPDSEVVEISHGGDDAGVKSCEECIAAKKFWQSGTCRVGCPRADVACYADADGCRRLEETEAAAKTCPTFKSCRDCAGAKHCGWRLSEDECFVAADYWGPPEEVVRHSQVDRCP